MDTKYLENNELIEKIKVDRTTTIYWYAEENENYRVRVMLFNREIYNRVLDNKHYKIYYNYINERVKYLIEGEILNKEYSMILLDNTMYQVIDKISHFKELNRILIPIEGEYYYNISDNVFDLVLGCTIRTGEIFDENDLVYHNGIFYTDGKVLCSIRDFDRVGIEYEPFDLLQGLTMEQSDYLFQACYFKLDVIKIKNYVTNSVNIKIGW